ncbi:MAG: M12 family metallo-peptidase [Granulosicoccus sp.]
MKLINCLRILVGLFFLIISAQAHASADEQYEKALATIESGDYGSALAQLRRLQRDYPGFSKLAAAQTRIAVLQESADAGESLPVFLNALSLRDEGRIQEALAELQLIADAYPAGTLTDDALYITAYLQVMDRYDFAAARVSLQTLQQRFPESAYSDSAQYLDAIAMEQLGDTLGARQALIELRERHTALSLPMNFRWPVGSVLSRYWFDRADRRLAIVEERIAGASTVAGRETQIDGRLRLGVNVGGVDMQLLLVPSPLTRTTQWLDAALTDQAPPSIGVFDGTVEGVDNSWVRAVLQNGSLTGVVNIDGVQQRLTPANLMGTLDYYQPRSRKGTLPGSHHSDLADTLQGLDVLVAPPNPRAGLSSRTRSVQTDVRAVPLSIVVDSQYDRYYAGEGLANALNNLNVADGVYRQFGLALTLDEALEFEEDADPLQLGAMPLESILRSFRDYRLRYKTIFEDSALSYLFTGNPKTDITLGLAWIDTACRLDGYDVGVTTPSSFGDVLLTHELGHSFGAQHDSDTACSENQDAVMWPNISERTRTNFSSCSKQSVLSAKSKSCLKNSVDLAVSAGISGTSISFSVLNPDGALTLDAQLDVETSAPDQLQWPAGCQVQTPTGASCQLGALRPGENRVIDFPVTQEFQNRDAPVTAQVSPVNALELLQSNNLATVSLTSGESNQHLSIDTKPVGLTQMPVVESQGTPVAGAASSSGSTNLLALLVLAFAGVVRFFSGSGKPWLLAI